MRLFTESASVRRTGPCVSSLRGGYTGCEMRILVVEDEPRLAALVCRVLGEEGYTAEAAPDGRSALARALSEPFDLLIVDWMLPGLDGLGLVRSLRAAEMSVPVLMLTARGQIEDRVEGLDAGADDYLPKPFAFPELLARVRALVRWPRGEGSGPEPTATLSAGDVTLDAAGHAVWRAGERIDLSAREFALLATLLRRPGRVFSREVLLDTVWDGSPDVYTNVVDLYVSYLRKKLDRPGDTSHIRTVRGVGYTFEPHDGAKDGPRGAARRSGRR
ncbi:response regulator transcription factor [Rubrobacter radiotolerans]|uniref:Response regulator transcription factor n=2 Tax=Rubrobacter radiotolerans TaxID=42256 RepID=A0AB35T7I9_RUBRA|nr:response regulator transcription factor [Rubrobacter radiotolerans]MDX5895468.1 response regulator transcription factor [Rubrobacter radiotolerans]